MESPDFVVWSLVLFTCFFLIPPNCKSLEVNEDAINISNNGKNVDSEHTAINEVQHNENMVIETRKGKNKKDNKGRNNKTVPKNKRNTNKRKSKGNGRKKKKDGKRIPKKKTTRKSVSCSFNDDDLVISQDTRSALDPDSGYTWVGGKIPFYFTPSVTPQDQKLILRAMQMIHQKTCFRFEKQNTQPSRDVHHLEIKTGTMSCFNNFSAGVYLEEDTKVVVLNSNNQLADHKSCNWEGYILHELFHVLGVMHTQKRKDRDNYIAVNYINVNDSDEARHQYDVCFDCSIHTEYECDSIMHYGTKSSASPDAGGPTMIANDPSTCQLDAWAPHEATQNDWQLLNIISSDVCSGGEVLNGDCYDAKRRSLPHAIYAGAKNSVDYCKDRCYEEGFLYAGVENRNFCWCGHYLPLSSLKKLSRECNLPCPADGSQTCGGAGRMNVFLTTTESCPIGWTLLATGCYKFLDSVTYQEGVTKCNEDGGYLAEITSQAEQDTLWQFYQDSGLPLNWVWGVSSVWIGANDLIKDGDWRWQQSGTKMTYNAWYNGEPNGGTRENCAQAWGHIRFQWNDLYCNYKIKALCEKGSHQYLTSPNYPNNYPNYLDKEYSLSVPNGNFIQVEFEDFEIEYHPHCIWDYIQFYDGDGRSYGKFCGSGPTTSLVIQTAKAKAVFHTDWCVTRRGFRFSYQPVKAGDHTETQYFTLDGGFFGTWGYSQKCRYPHFVTKMELKIEDNQGEGDDTGLNAIRLTCSNGHTISSTKGQRGTWQAVHGCPAEKFMVGAQIRHQGCDTSMRVGATVVRNALDWPQHYGNQDGGPGHKGTVTSLTGSGYHDNGWIVVQWENGDSDDYRWGHQGKMDVKVFCKDCETSMRVGTKVVRNEVDWRYGDQDGGLGSLGTIVKKENTVLYVKWDLNGQKWDYKWSQDGKTDVKPYCEDLSSANGVRFTCSDASQSTFSTRYPGDGHVGDWTESASCEQGSAVVGLSTQIQAPQGDGGDTGLNDVRFYCAELPNVGTIYPTSRTARKENRVNLGFTKSVADVFTKPIMYVNKKRQMNVDAAKPNTTHQLQDIGYFLPN